jgi:hypothetical protein
LATKGPFLDERAINYFLAWYLHLSTTFMLAKYKGVTVFFFVFLVLLPSAVQPQGVDGFFLPIDVLPSPPPCGWCTGLIAAPRTIGHLPSQRVDPALPKPLLFVSVFPIRPTLAKQSWSVKQISPEGSLKIANLPSLATTFAAAPAGLPSHSILCVA